MLQRHAITLFLTLSLAVHALMAWLFLDNPNERQVISARSISLLVSQQAPDVPAAEPETTETAEPTKTRTPVPTEVVSQQKPAPTQQVIKPADLQPAEPAPVATTEVAQQAKPSPRQPSAKASTSSVARSKVTQHVQLALIRELNYPMIARRRGWEGVVIIAVHLDAQGNLSDFRMIKTSGYPILDASATRSLQRLAAVPEVIHWLNGRELNIELPVEYRLIDS